MQDGTIAPGARVRIQDAEWPVQRTDTTSDSGQVLDIVDLSELVEEGPSRHRFYQRVPIRENLLSVLLSRSGPLGLVFGLFAHAEGGRFAELLACDYGNFNRVGVGAAYEAVAVLHV